MTIFAIEVRAQFGERVCEAFGRVPIENLVADLVTEGRQAPDVMHERRQPEHRRLDDHERGIFHPDRRQHEGIVPG